MTGGGSPDQINFKASKNAAERTQDRCIIQRFRYNLFYMLIIFCVLSKIFFLSSLASESF